jgi:uncharacterized protein YrrD
VNIFTESTGILSQDKTMLNIVRRSQVVGLIAIDQSRATNLGSIEEVWLDQSGRVSFFSSTTRYLPLEQISRVGTDGISTYGDLAVSEPEHVHQLYQSPVSSTQGDRLGWVDDFLFDWQSGDIAAYILVGDVASPWSKRVVLFPEGVISVSNAGLIVKADSEKTQLQEESEGLQAFLSEKSQQVRKLVQMLGDQLHSLISSQDKPDVVRVKIRQASDELANSAEIDHSALQEATTFLQEHWQSFQQGISHTSTRLKNAIEQAWRYLPSMGNR